jgi:CO dehydrogenase/acetyl-CoA synthase alpha subunit
METMTEKLNRVLWDNLCLDVIEMDSISYETLRPMKAKLQPDLEKFIQEEISLALQKRDEELMMEVEKSENYLLKEGEDEDNNDTYSGYQWGINSAVHEFKRIINKPL